MSPVTGTRDAPGVRVQTGNTLRFQSFRLTTIRGRRGLRDRVGDWVRMLAQPVVGRPMVMYGGQDDRRIITSPVIRLFEDFSGQGTYVQTENTLYLLQQA